ncbi:extracellular solute-binding protein [Paenibacillus yanchengensis]|uniref:Extracellular solute-binding protein n=1 Tax=Paenibacillus yanchengensis TaxID=2035833 RepID=A0ABW4YNV7_9BACL
MNKKSKALPFYWLVVLLVLTSCSNDAGDREKATDHENSNVNQREDVDYANSKAELTIFSIESPEMFEELFGQHIKQKFPNYKITYIGETSDQKIDHIIASGTKIDIYIDRVGDLTRDYIPRGLAYDMTPLVEKHNIDLNRFEAGYVADGTFDESLFMLPLLDNKFVLYYNKDIFDKFGVAYPTDGMTWEEVFGLSKQITRSEGGKQYIGLWTSPKHFIRVNPLSLDFVDAATSKAKVNMSEWKQFFDEVIFPWTSDPGIQRRANENWLNHGDFNKEFNVAMYIYQDIWMATAEDSLAMNWDIVSVPTFKDKPKVGMQAYTRSAGITATSKHKDAAMLVIDYLTSEEFQMILSRKGMITPLKSEQVRAEIYADTPFKEDKNLQALFYNGIAPSRNYHQYDEHVINAFEKYIMEVSQGKMDEVTALRSAEEKANQLIQEQSSQQ